MAVGAALQHLSVRTAESDSTADAATKEPEAHRTMLTAKVSVVHIRSAGRRDPAVHKDQAAHTAPAAEEARIVRTAVAEHTAPVAVAERTAPVATEVRAAPAAAVQHTAALAVAEVQALAAAVRLIAVEPAQSIWAEAALSLEQPGASWEPARW